MQYNRQISIFFKKPLPPSSPALKMVAAENSSTYLLDYTVSYPTLQEPQISKRPTLIFASCKVGDAMVPI
jgi:hypothetical protein